MMYHLEYQETPFLLQLALIQNINMERLLVLDVELLWKLREHMKMMF